MVEINKIYLKSINPLSEQILKVLKEGTVIWFILNICLTKELSLKNF